MINGIADKFSTLVEVSLKCVASPVARILKKGGYLALSLVSVVAAYGYFRDMVTQMGQREWSKSLREAVFGIGWLALALFIACTQLFERRTPGPLGADRERKAFKAKPLPPQKDISRLFTQRSYRSFTDTNFSSKYS